MSDKVQPTAPSNAFSVLLADHRKGSALTELTQAMQTCVAAAQEAYKPASLTLKITFTPAGDALCVTDSVDIKLPKVEREKSIFFANPDNTLSRSKHTQPDLPIRELEKPDVEVREVRTAAAN